MKRVCLLALLLAGCQTTAAPWETLGDAVHFCMTLGEVPQRVDGKIGCTENP